MRKYFKILIFIFVLFTFTYFNVYNSINASTIDEENVEVDEESKTSVEQNEYYGYGCYNCTDLIENYNDEVMNYSVDGYYGLGCSSTCGPSRKNGYSSEYVNLCRNWQLMPSLHNLNKYWIDESSLSSLSENEKKKFIDNVNKAAETWNSIRIVDWPLAIANLEEELEYSDGVVPVRYNPTLEKFAGVFNPVIGNYYIEIKDPNYFDTMLHEFGHMLGLQDLDLLNNSFGNTLNGTHVALMGYASGKAFSYHDIQGVAVRNGKHTNHDFKRYWVDGNEYHHICFYCDVSNVNTEILSEALPFIEASTCSQECEEIVSAGERHWLKCTKCYKVIESEFTINVLNSNDVEITGILNEKVDITIPDYIDGFKVVSIADNTFKDYWKLKTITFESNCDITNIGSYAFKGCYKISEINIPITVTSIGVGAFEGCTALTDVIFPTNITQIESNLFKDCVNLKNINIPNSVTSIGTRSFEQCVKINSFNIPSNLISIENYAFKGCTNISYLIFPNTLNNIGDNAFEDCSLLENIWINGTDNNVIILGNNVFEQCSEDLKIHVDQYKYGAYISSIYWQDFIDIIESNQLIEAININCLTKNKSFDAVEHDGLYQLNISCAFTYNFVTEYDVNMKLYNNSMTEIFSGENIISRLFNAGVYYYEVIYTKSDDINNIDINYGISTTHNRTEIYYENISNITQIMNSDCADLKHGFYLYNNENGPGFYNFKVNAGNSNLYPEGAISIYSDINCTQLIDRYNLNNLTLDATTKLNENELFVYLPDDGCYYINVILYNENYSNITLSIENVEENYYDYSNSILSSGLKIIFEGVKKVSYFEKVTFSHDVKIEMDVYTNISLNSLGCVYIFKEVKEPTNIYGEYNYSLETIYASQIGSPDWLAVFTLMLGSGTYYFGYDNNLNKTSVNFAFNRIVNHDECSGDVLVTDPALNQGYVLGTEVLFNNGLYGATTITEGFTRNIYLMVEDRVHDPMSRLDYSWYSSDESKAMVTSYGTVLALPVEEDSTVTIYAIRKSDPSVIYYETFTILNDTEEDLIEIECNLSYSYSKKNGTYQLALNSTNCPYPMIQYYTWEVIDSGDETVTIGNWGHVTSTGITEAIIVGTYELNPRVRLYINLNITE